MKNLHKNSLNFLSRDIVEFHNRHNLLPLFKLETFVDSGQTIT